MDIINPPSLAKPVGYNHGIKASGNFLAIAGQVGWDGEGRLVGGGFAGEFSKALENVIAVIREAGGGPHNLISLTIFVTSKDRYLESLKAIGAEYRRLMGRHYPAMTLVEIKGLVEEGAQIEIQGMAVL